MNPLVLVGGDFHGVWGPVNAVINRKRPDIFLQCGDFGWWPRFHNTTAIDTGENRWSESSGFRKPKPWDMYGLKLKDTKMYFCDGNHEDHWALKAILRQPVHGDPPEMGMNNLFYMRRGKTLTLPDGRTVLFMGGADSIDKDARTLGVDWFPEEIITQSDMMNLPDVNVDIVISHTCPLEFFSEVVTYKIVEPSNHALSYVLDHYKPDLWFFGHFHCFKKGKHNNTNWHALNMVPDSGWWIPLP